jgi:hypothetical protein
LVTRLLIVSAAVPPTKFIEKRISRQVSPAITVPGRKRIDVHAPDLAAPRGAYRGMAWRSPDPVFDELKNHTTREIVMSWKFDLTWPFKK